MMTSCPVDTADWPQALKDRPVCPKRKTVIPFINEIAPDGTGLFAILDDRQARRCLARLCAMCGGPMGEFVALLGNGVSLRRHGGFFIEAPVHERCGEIAVAGLCPFLSRERVPRRPVAEGLAVVGDPADLAHVGRTKAKRPLVMAIVRDYAPALAEASGGHTLVYQAGQHIERVRWFSYRDDRAREIPIPESWPAAVRRLQVCPKRRLPIPYSAMVNEDGTGNFTITDQEATMRCAKGRLCGVCGDPLGRHEVTFLGGPASADPKYGAYTDPPMHEGCATFSLGLCPHIARPNVPRRSQPIDLPTADPAGFDEGRPAGWVMVIAAGSAASFVRTPNGPALLFRPARHLRVRTFAYDERGVLAETTPPPRVVTVVRAQPRRRPKSRR